MAKVIRADAQDLIPIRALLERSGLPTSDLDSARPDFVVIRENGQVIAAGALQPFGPSALLRSVVVAPDRRERGLGRTVVNELERMARTADIGQLILLTQTAAEFFAHQRYRVLITACNSGPPIHHQHNQIGGAERTQRLFHRPLGRWFARVKLQAAAVHHHEFTAFVRGDCDIKIPRGPGNRADDRAGAAHDSVEKGGFADICTAGQHDDRAIARPCCNIGGPIGFSNHSPFLPQEAPSLSGWGGMRSP